MVQGFLRLNRFLIESPKDRRTPGIHSFPKSQNRHDLYGGSAFRNANSFCRNRSARHAPSGGFRETPLQRKRPLLRKLAVNPFDLVYTYDAERDIVFIEAPINQRTAW